MDEVDSVAAHIAQGMYESGDWLTPRINAVKFLEKAPLNYWFIAAGYALFGVHDWVARLPVALAVLVLVLVTYWIGRWVWGPRSGLFAGLAMVSCAGMFLFTRIILPDAALTLCVTFAIFCAFRALEGGDWRWSAGCGAAIGTGLLLKGLIALVAPGGAVFVYLLIQRRLLRLDTWRAFRPHLVAASALAISTPWYAAATLANPPYFDFTLRSDPGVYRGFFWFYFINEHVLRFLGLRYPKDYDTVPRLAFWLLHLAWLFPWSVFAPAAARLPQQGRARRWRTLCLCWIGFLLVFLSFSTTQEYYSMPCYPAMALLLGDALARGERRWIRPAGWVLVAIGGLVSLAIGVVLYAVRGMEATGDITSQLTSNPDAYALALGHMQDLTIASMAHLRGPLVSFGLSFLVGAVALAINARRISDSRLVTATILALMMTGAFWAAHWAMASFDPLLSSRPLAADLAGQAPGQLVIDGHFYPHSSLAFYVDSQALLLDGVKHNTVYGAAAPGAPDVFLDRQRLRELWGNPEPIYLVTRCEERGRIAGYVEDVSLAPLASRGGKCLFANHTLPHATPVDVTR